MGVAITFSSGIRRLTGLASLLDVDAVRGSPWPLGRSVAPGDVVVGWGNKLNTRRARRFASGHGLPYLRLEDGFLRSVGLGVGGAPPYSLVIDDIGIYYDASRPSRLEHLLNGQALPALPGGNPVPAGPDALDDPALLERARRCMARIVAARLSKYNSSPERLLPRCDRRRILVVDQTAGDQSIAGGLAGPATFARMLAAARREHPDAEILIKTHPDVRSGRKHGHFGADETDERTQLLTADINPIHLLEQVDQVYVVTSQLGFEALLVGRPVTCFGVPFYAGWGLTDDRMATPRRIRQRSLEQVFAAAYLLYARYLDPDLGRPCELERVVEHLALQRHWFRRNAGTWLCVNFEWKKRWYVRHYLASPGNEIRFYQRPSSLPAGLPADTTKILVWGKRDDEKLRDLARTFDYPIWRMEDGFIRSVSLGFVPAIPVSQIVDSRGIYFDPESRSDLETLLAERQYSLDELQRARDLRQQLVAARLSKYNLGERTRSLEHQAKPGQRIVLVPGQVEDDASIRCGTVDIRSNAALLREVRKARPDAYILYKPHPDVVSGNRPTDAERPAPGDYDQFIDEASIATCIEVADEVHTMTSLTGFEALLRGKAVFTYGLPFYAGWGLTVDRHDHPDRPRRLSIDELVAAALILYPRYLNVSTREFTTPEHAIRLLGQDLASARNTRLKPRPMARPIAMARAFLTGLLRELLRRK